MTALPPTKENMICFGNIIYYSLPTLLAGHKQDTTQAYMLSQVPRMAAVTMVLVCNFTELHTLVLSLCTLSYPMAILVVVALTVAVLVS